MTHSAQRFPIDARRKVHGLLRKGVERSTYVEEAPTRVKHKKRQEQRSRKDRQMNNTCLAKKCGCVGLCLTLLLDRFGAVVCRRLGDAAVAMFCCCCVATVAFDFFAAQAGRGVTSTSLRDASVPALLPRLFQRGEAAATATHVGHSRHRGRYARLRFSADRDDRVGADDGVGDTPE